MTRFARQLAAFGFAMLWLLASGRDSRIRANRCTSSCRSPPAALPTSWRARSARNSPSCGASRSSSTIEPGPAGPSARRSSPSRRPTATRCWCIPPRTPTTRRSIPTCPSIRPRISSKSCRSPGSRTCSWSRRRRASRSVAELIALAKQKPGQLNFGSGRHRQRNPYQRRKIQARRGHRRAPHPYKGTPEALTDHDGGAGDVFLFADFRGAAQRARRQAAGTLA